MSTLKVNELWQEVEKAFRSRTTAGYKAAILDAHKILERVLASKGYPGKTVDRKLYWAGYSLKNQKNITEALVKYDEVMEKFEISGSDFDVEEILRTYKKIINEVAGKPAFGIREKYEAFVDVYLSPKSIPFWRNIVILFGTFAIIKLLAYTEIGKKIIGWIVAIANFAISWLFVIVVIVIIIAALLLNYYFSNKTKVKIKG